MCLARHAQITQNNKFAISLQYFKKEVSDEIDFLHPDKHKSLLQIDTMVLTEMVKYSQSSQNNKLAMYYNISKKKLEMKLLFCMQINVKVSYKLFSTLWALMFPTSWYYHFWWAWSSIFKVLKVITLQYLYNISKKKIRNVFYFLHADKHQSFYKLALSFWWKWSVRPKYPKQKVFNTFAIY